MLLTTPGFVFGAKQINSFYEYFVSEGELNETFYKYLLELKYIKKVDNKVTKNIPKIMYTYYERIK